MLDKYSERSSNPSNRIYHEYVTRDAKMTRSYNDGSGLIPLTTLGRLMGYSSTKIRDYINQLKSLLIDNEFPVADAVA